MGQQKGFEHREDTKRQISETMKGRVPLAIHIKRECPTCGVVMGAGNLGRHAPICDAKKKSGIFPDKTVFEMKQLRRKLRPYGLTPESYHEIWKRQGGVCNICGEDKSFGDIELAVDHCHRTGHVRGLLCTACNKILGLAKDNPDVLLRAAQYLDQNNRDPYQKDGCDSATPNNDALYKVTFS